jgi:hypothetical protein
MSWTILILLIVLAVFACAFGMSEWLARKVRKARADRRDSLG